MMSRETDLESLLTEIKHKVELSESATDRELLQRIEEIMTDRLEARTEYGDE